MNERTRMKHSTAKLTILPLVLCALSTMGCQWVHTRYEALRGPGFNDMNQGGVSVRGDANEAKPSGFFTDKRSDQIEQNLGGF
jgi:hypothetical protein